MRTTFDTSGSRARYIGLSRGSLRLALSLIVVALLLIALDNAGLMRPVKGRAQQILAPVEQALTQTRVGIRSRLEILGGTSALQRRIAALEDEVAGLRETNIRLQSLQAENDKLKLELGIRQTYEWETASAAVVQANMENGRRIMRIDRGRGDGIEVGMAVVAKEGGSPAALVGVVDVVYAQTADVLLVTDYGSSISAHTTQPDPAKGLVLGQWQVGSRIRLVDVDPATRLNVGDYVVTSGLSKGLATEMPMAQIPANIPVGTVISLSRTIHTQSAEVQPFVDPDRVRNVWVITGQK